MNAHPQNAAGPASAGELTVRLDAFAAAWRANDPPSIADYLPPAGDVSRVRILRELVHVDLECRWRTSPTSPAASALSFPARPLLVDYARRYPELGEASDWPLQSIAEEYRVRARWGDAPGHAEYQSRFPERTALAAALARVDDELLTEGARGDQASSASHSREETEAFSPRKPSLAAADETPDRPPRATTVPADAGGGVESQTPVKLPARVGRYRVEQLLGRGGFGLVLLAHDEQLHRQVAVKLPHAHLLAHAEDLDLYLAEARTVAQLDHPRIVPVYDVGSTAEHPCFVVSKVIEGESLSARLKRGRLPRAEAVELVAGLADALHYAHARDVVHRDVKPSNVLLDRQGQAHLVDFGLALGPDSFGQGARFCGTVAYMSPEQAGGRAQHVDGRSDIYSLGVVFYELLTGASPYRGRERASVLAEIANQSISVRPPRQVDAALPEALERVCLRALAKRPDDRYTTAADMAGDLRAYLAADASPAKPARRRAVVLGTLAAVGAIAVAVALVVLPDRPTGTAGSSDAGSQSGAGVGASAVDGAAAAALPPIKVVSVEFQQLVRDEQGNHERSGLVLRDTYKLREGDGLQFQAKLSRPAYCFWLGFKPDGEMDLCYPEDPDQPPPLSDVARYPIDDPDGVVYGLTDGAGTQAFALIASDTPLPSYNAWRAARGDSPWRPTHGAPADRIYVNEDGWERDYELQRRYATRGAGEPLQGRPSVLTDLVGWLRNDKQFVAVEAWALPVRPRAESENGSGEP